VGCGPLGAVRSGHTEKLGFRAKPPRESGQDLACERPADSGISDFEGDVAESAIPRVSRPCKLRNSGEAVKIRTFRNLEVWQAAMDLTVACYEVARRLPAEERFGLGSQIRRAAVSVPSNIAEGHATRSDRGYCAIFELRAALWVSSKLRSSSSFASSSCRKRP
jgi:hypothetical protein